MALRVFAETGIISDPVHLAYNVDSYIAIAVARPRSITQLRAVAERISLHSAMVTGDTSILHWILYEQEKEFKVTPLRRYHYLIHSTLEVREWLYSHGVPIVKCKYFMRCAVFSGNLELMTWLYERGGKVPPLPQSASNRVRQWYIANNLS